MGRALLALGLAVILIGLFMLASPQFLDILNPPYYRSTSPNSSRESQDSETEHETEQSYGELRANLYLKSEEWTRASETGLPLCENTVDYEILDNGTTMLEDVQVAISIDGAVFEQFSLQSLPPNTYFTDQLSVSVD